MRRLRSSVLRHRDFRLLFWGQAASNLGSNAVAVAMALYITRTTGSPTDLGVILASQDGDFAEGVRAFLEKRTPDYGRRV